MTQHEDELEASVGCLGRPSNMVVIVNKSLKVVRIFDTDGSRASPARISAQLGIGADLVHVVGRESLTAILAAARQTKSRTQVPEVRVRNWVVTIAPLRSGGLMLVFSRESLRGTQLQSSLQASRSHGILKDPSKVLHVTVVSPPNHARGAEPGDHQTPAEPPVLASSAPADETEPLVPAGSGDQEASPLPDDQSEASDDPMRAGQESHRIGSDLHLSSSRHSLRSLKQWSDASLLLNGSVLERLVRHNAPIAYDTVSVLLLKFHDIDDAAPDVFKMSKYIGPAHRALDNLLGKYSDLHRVWVPDHLLSTFVLITGAPLLIDERSKHNMMSGYFLTELASFAIAARQLLSHGIGAVLPTGERSIVSFNATIGLHRGKLTYGAMIAPVPRIHIQGPAWDHVQHFARQPHDLVLVSDDFKGVLSKESAWFEFEENLGSSAGPHSWALTKKKTVISHPSSHSLRDFGRITPPFMMGRRNPRSDSEEESGEINPNDGRGADDDV